jgi:hypothetical protein
MVAAMNELVQLCSALQRDNDILMRSNAQLLVSLQDKIDILDGLAEGPQTQLNENTNG